MCEKCEATKRLHAHHIKCYYKNKSLRTDIKNGQILCQSCHMKLEAKIRKIKKENG